VRPDVSRTREAVRDDGLLLGIVSNAAYRTRLMKQQLAGLGLAGCFDAVTFSSEVGVRTPHPAIYADALSKLAADPSRTIFVGDRVREDVQGPQAQGMRAVLTREWRQEDDPGVADFVIQRLGELAPIVNRLAPGTRGADTYNEVTSRE